MARATPAAQFWPFLTCKRREPSMNQAARLARWFVIGALTLLAIPVGRADEKKEPNPLEALAPLVGGAWIGEGRHGPDTKFRTRVVYEWGLNRRVPKAKSYGVRAVLMIPLICPSGSFRSITTGSGVWSMPWLPAASKATARR